MGQVNHFKARFFAPEWMKPMNENRLLWAENLRQRQPIYEHGRLIIFDECITQKSLADTKAYFTHKAEANHWELIDVTEAA